MMIMMMMMVDDCLEAHRWFFRQFYLPYPYPYPYPFRIHVHVLKSLFPAVLLCYLHPCSFGFGFGFDFGFGFGFNGRAIDAP